MEKKTLKNAMLIIAGILIVALIAVSIIKIGSDPYTSIARMIVLVPTAVYAFCLYGIPHGNYLKYTIFIFLVFNAFSVIFFVSDGSDLYLEAARLLCLGAITYCSGRLHRIDRNRIIFTVVAAALFIINIISIIKSPGADVLSVIWSFSMPVSFLTILLAYFTRFEEHREAGLAESQTD